MEKILELYQQIILQLVKNGQPTTPENIVIAMNLKISDIYGGKNNDLIPIHDFNLKDNKVIKLHEKYILNQQRTENFIKGKTDEYNKKLSINNIEIPKYEKMISLLNIKRTDQKNYLLKEALKNGTAIMAVKNSPTLSKIDEQIKVLETKSKEFKGQAIDEIKYKNLIQALEITTTGRNELLQKELTDQLEKLKVDGAINIFKKFNQILSKKITIEKTGNVTETNHDVTNDEKKLLLIEANKLISIIDTHVPEFAELLKLSLGLHNKSELNENGLPTPERFRENIVKKLSDDYFKPKKENRINIKLAGKKYILGRKDIENLKSVPNDNYDISFSTYKNKLNGNDKYRDVTEQEKKNLWNDYNELNKAPEMTIHGKRTLVMRQLREAMDKLKNFVQGNKYFEYAMNKNK